jgi:hypothetical protein
MNLSTQNRRRNIQRIESRRSIRFSPECYNTTVAGSLRARLEKENHRAYTCLSSPSLSSTAAASSPSPLMHSSKSNQKQKQYYHHHPPRPEQHQQQPIVTIIPSVISYSDVCVGELLGSGAYASVYNVSFPSKNKRQKSFTSPYRLQFGNDDQEQEQRQPPTKIRRSYDDDDVVNKDMSSAHDDTQHSLDLEQLHEHPHHLKHKHHHHLKSHNEDHSIQHHHAFYALKCLQQDNLLVLQDGSRKSKVAKIATTDFLMECKILSKIHTHHKGHPNIIGLIGISRNFAHDPSRGFLVLEKVSETLQEALVRWRKNRGGGVGGENHTSHSSSSSHNNMSISPPALHQRLKNSTNKKRLLQREQRERIRVVGLGVARALQFLHEHRIIYRGKVPCTTTCWNTNHTSPCTLPPKSKHSLTQMAPSLSTLSPLVASIYVDTTTTTTTTILPG